MLDTFRLHVDTTASQCCCTFVSCTFHAANFPLYYIPKAFYWIQICSMSHFTFRPYLHHYTLCRVHEWAHTKGRIHQSIWKVVEMVAEDTEAAAVVYPILPCKHFSFHQITLWSNVRHVCIDWVKWIVCSDVVPRTIEGFLAGKPTLIVVFSKWTTGELEPNQESGEREHWYIHWSHCHIHETSFVLC